jgi:hypothetical protein
VTKRVEDLPLYIEGQLPLIPEPTRRPSVYLAGSSRDTTRVRLIADRLAEAEIEVVHRWFDLPADKLGHDAALSDAEQRSVSSACFGAMYKADAFWMLMPGHGLPPSSCLIELGRALAIREYWAEYPVIVTGSAARTLALTVDADFRDSSDSAGLLAVFEMLGRKA